MMAARELRELLDQERALILEGAFEDVARLAELKARLLDAAASGKNQNADYEELRDRARRNASLLSAASDGIRSAIQHIQEAHGMMDQTTYHKGGAKTRLARSRPSIERRF